MSRKPPSSSINTVQLSTKTNVSVLHQKPCSTLINSLEKTGHGSGDGEWQEQNKSFKVPVCWQHLCRGIRELVLSRSSSSASLCHWPASQETENNLTCSAMGLPCQAKQQELQRNNGGGGVFTKFSYRYVGICMHSSAVIIIMKPDVFIICHSHRQVPHPQRVAPYRPLVVATIAVGTLTSKRLNSFSFIISPHTDEANVFTLVWDIKVILHQKEFLFEGSDTSLLQRSIEFSSLEQDVFEQLKTAGPKKEEEEEQKKYSLFLSL